MEQLLHKGWHNLLDLRALLLFAVVGLMAFDWRPQSWELPAAAITDVGRFLNPVPRKPPEVALIRVARPELALWGLAASADDPTDQRLPRALATLAEQGKTIGIVLPYPVDAFDLNASALDSLAEDEQSLQEGRLSQLLKQQMATHHLLTSRQLVLGVSKGRMAGQTALSLQEGDLAQVPGSLREWLWPLQSLSDAPVFPQSTLTYYPVMASPKAEQPLLFRAEGEFASEQSPSTPSATYAGFALALLQHARQARQLAAGQSSQDWAWYRDAGMRQGGELVVPTSAQGTVVPVVNGYSTMEPSFAHLSLAAAIVRPVNSDIVLIGSSDDASLEQLAATVVALTEGLVLTEPAWFTAANKLLLLAALLFLLFVVPRVRWVTGVFLCTALCASLATAQLWAQLNYSWWTPLADLLWLLTGGFVIMLIWQDMHLRRTEQQRQLALMGIAHAQQLTEQGQLRQAHQTLIGYTPPNQAYQPYMSLAEAFASQGDYAEALQIVEDLEPPLEKKTEWQQKCEHWQRLATQVVKGPSAGQSLADTVVMELQGPNHLGRYEVQREIGRGAMGIVYLGYDPRIARKVAVKTLNFKHFEDPQLTQLKTRFFREAEAAGRLNHPNIVSVYDVGEEQDLAFIAMDYVDGQPLSKYASSGHQLNPAEVYRIVAQVARAVHYAHQHNIIHRDIKPANIIYAAEPYQLKVTDFGIARLVDESRTSTGEILGSPLYIAPEQLQGEKVGPAADVFSLGVTFYQLLTGHLPFAGDNLASLTYNIIHSKPQSVRKYHPKLPASATRIVNRALQKDPGKRYSSAQEMAEALEKALKRDFAGAAKVGF